MQARAEAARREEEARQADQRAVERGRLFLERQQLATLEERTRLDLRGHAAAALLALGLKAPNYGSIQRGFYEERMKGWQRNPTGDAPQPPAIPGSEAEYVGGARINPLDILVQAQPGGARQIRLERRSGHA